jgi:phage shock protein E
MRSILSFVFLLVVIVSYAQKKEIKSLSAEEFKTSLASTENAVLLDLRTNDEIKKGMITGARQLDYFRTDFEDQIKTLDKSKPYFLYCAVGGRSSETLELMSSLGFAKVYHLREGITGWKKKKFPLVIPK